MKNILHLFLLAAALFSAHLTTFAADASLPSFIYTGRITDYKGEGLDGASESKAEIRARSTNNVILARANIIASTNDTASNFVLYIPMASSPRTDAACTGDKLTFEIEYTLNGQKIIYTASNSFAAVGLPGRASTLNLFATTCSNSYGVPDDYISELLDYAAENGYAYTSYDPNADWDGDGVSNYNEFLAGTDPLNADDFLHFLSFDYVASNTNVMEATFLPARSHAYFIERAAPEDMTDTGFAQRQHAATSAADAPKRTYLITPNTDPDTTALYLFKEGSSSVYRLKVEQ